MNLRKKKVPLCCSYNPHISNIANYLDVLRKAPSNQISKYDNFLIVRDFNLETSETVISNFCDMHHLYRLVKGPTYYKNPNKLSCISFLLKNFLNSAMKTQTLEIGLLYFQKLTFAVLKIHFQKPKQKL